MARRKIVLVEEAVARLNAPTRPRKRPETVPEPPPPPKEPPRATAMRLAAEVDRLKAELAAANVRMAELEATADVDVLLDIFNRRAFDRELRRSAAYVRRYGTPAAVVYLDLDYFKLVNDRYGHSVGDIMLKAVAKTLQRTVRASDLVARLGGDEFGVLLWNVSEIQAAAKARQLEAAIAATVVMHAGAALSVGVSAGFARLGPGDEPADVISRADLAMYMRKRVRRAAAG
jgi:diguanylate cyclase (GGDEF)-like protein